MTKNLTRSRMCSYLQSLFDIIAFILLWFGSLNCNFVKFTDTSGTSEPISLEFGLFYYRYWSLVYSVDGKFIVESCRGYPNSIDLDGSWTAARAFSILAFIFAILIIVGSIVSACSADSDSRRSADGWEAPLYLLVALCQGLTLLVLNSDVCKNNILVRAQDEVLDRITFPDTCSISAGAKYSISSMVFFFASGVASFAAHRAEKMETFPEAHALLLNP